MYDESSVTGVTPPFSAITYHYQYTTCVFNIVVLLHDLLCVELQFMDGYLHIPATTSRNS